MTDPEIPMLPIEEAKARAIELEMPESIAELSVFRPLLHHPKLAQRVNDLLLTLLIGRALDARLLGLIIMRIGWATGSVYEWTQHWRVALQLGVSAEDVLAVRGGARGMVHLPARVLRERMVGAMEPPGGRIRAPSIHRGPFTPCVRRGAGLDSLRALIA